MWLICLRRVSVRFVPGVCLGCLLLAGCGGDGPARISVEGKATFQGAPVEEALISFLPVTGEPGPAANAIIRSGRYHFDTNNGPTAGPHRVIVLAEADKKAAFFAADGDPSASEQGPSGRWEFETEVPAEGPFQYDVTLE